MEKNNTAHLIDIDFASFYIEGSIVQVEEYEDVKEAIKAFRKQ